MCPHLVPISNWSCAPRIPGLGLPLVGEVESTRFLKYVLVGPNKFSSRSHVDVHLVGLTEILSPRLYLNLRKKTDKNIYALIHPHTLSHAVGPAFRMKLDPSAFRVSPAVSTDGGDLPHPLKYSEPRVAKGCPPPDSAHHSSVHIK